MSPDPTPPLCMYGDRADCTVCRDWPEWLRHTVTLDEVQP